MPLQTVDQTKATREEYLNYLRAVVLQFDLAIDTYERVTSIARGEDGVFSVTTSARTGERQRLARNVATAFGNRGVSSEYVMTVEEALALEVA